MIAQQLLQAHMVPASDISMMSGPRIFFAFFALLTCGGALVTITRRNLVSAVMWLVATFFGFAALFAMLDAHFLAALQVLVYAGAIMVLFIFVVMVLNRDELEPWSYKGLFTKAVIGIPTLAIMVFMIAHYVKEAAPATLAPSAESFGTVAEVGNVLFTDYIFAFEAISVLLLIAVIAAVVVAKTHRHDNPADLELARQHAESHAHPADHGHADAPATAAAPATTSAHGGH